MISYKPVRTFEELAYLANLCALELEARGTRGLSETLDLAEFLASWHEPPVLIVIAQALESNSERLDEVRRLAKFQARLLRWDKSPEMIAFARRLATAATERASFEQARADEVAARALSAQPT